MRHSTHHPLRHNWLCGGLALASSNVFWTHADKFYNALYIGDTATVTEIVRNLRQTSDICARALACMFSSVFEEWRAAEGLPVAVARIDEGLELLQAAEPSLANDEVWMLLCLQGSKLAWNMGDAEEGERLVAEAQVIVRRWPDEQSIQRWWPLVLLTTGLHLRNFASGGYVCTHLG